VVKTSATCWHTLCINPETKALNLPLKSPKSLSHPLHATIASGPNNQQFVKCETRSSMSSIEGRPSATHGTPPGPIFNVVAVTAAGRHSRGSLRRPERDRSRRGAVRRGRSGRTAGGGRRGGRTGIRQRVTFVRSRGSTAAPGEDLGSRRFGLGTSPGRLRSLGFSSSTRFGSPPWCSLCFGRCPGCCRGLRPPGPTSARASLFGGRLRSTLAHRTHSRILRNVSSRTQQMSCKPFCTQWYTA